MQYLSNLTSKHLQSGKFLTHISKILFANMVDDFCIVMFSHLQEVEIIYHVLVSNLLVLTNHIVNV